MDFLNKKILKKIKPTENENQKIEKIKKEIQNKLKKVCPDYVKIKLVGSIAKKTHLSKDLDFDFFLLFPTNISYNEMMKNAFFYSKKAFKKEKKQIKYANHPYIKIKYKDYEVDIIPSFLLDLNNPIKSAVDRSQLHTDFINQNTNEKLKDEIRFFKYFLKKNNLYGAETKIGGFSGYLCELFIIYYGSFLNAIKEISKYNKKQILFFKLNDKKKQEENTEEKIKEEIEKITEEIKEEKLNLNKFKDDHIVFIDPVDKDRNVASAISKNTLFNLILKCRKIMEKKQEKIIKKNQENKKEKDKQNKIDVEKKDKNNKQEKNQQNKINFKFVILKVKIEDKSEDIIYPKLFCLEKKIFNYLIEHGFDLICSASFIFKKQGIIVIQTNSFTCYDLKIKLGPSVYLKDATDDFLIKNKFIYLKNGNIFSIKKRKETDILKIINEKFLIKGKKITKDLEKLKNKKIKIKKEVKNLKISTDEKIIKKYFQNVLLKH